MGAKAAPKHSLKQAFSYILSLSNLPKLSCGADS